MPGQENALQETRESFAIHVRIVDHPETEVVLEADIVDDDPPHVSQTVDYTYDAFNRLVRKSLDGDGAGPLAAVDAFFSWYNGQIALHVEGHAAADVAHRYLWGPAVDQLLADEQVSSLTSAGDVLWPLSDHLGTTRDLATYDAQAGTLTLANHRRFDAYGRLVASSTTVTTAFGYTGALYEVATGLQYNRARWYDAAVGRWVSQDPIGFAGGDTNPSRYVHNSPIFAVDPSGKFWSLVVTAVFTAADTYQYATGRISGQDYAMRMAINAASAAADVMSAGMGGGLGVRGAALAARGAKAIAAAQRAARATSVALAGVRATNGIATGLRVAGGALNVASIGIGTAQAAIGTVSLITKFTGCDSNDRNAVDVALTGLDAFEAGYGAYGAGKSLLNSPLGRSLFTPTQLAPKGARGPATAWEGFDEALAGGPVRNLTTSRIKVTDRGISVVEGHIGRFGPDKANSVMVNRLKQIASGELRATPQDLNFYSHELREFTRYRSLGWANGVPGDGDAALNLWRQAHSATLDDYGLPLGRDDLLYDPTALPFIGQ